MVAPTFAQLDVEVPRPKDVGVLAMEMYFPRRVSVRCSLNMDAFLPLRG